MNYGVKKAPFIRKNISTDKIMLKLLICLVILYAFGLYNSYRYGMQFLINALLMLVVAVVVTLACEAIFALIKKEDILSSIKKSFGLITAIIIVLTLPANTKLWVVAVATLIGVVVGKLAFGGFGRNFLNPAALARLAVLLFWSNEVTMQAISSATVTSKISAFKWLPANETLLETVEAYFGLDSLLVGTYFGALGETSTLLILLMGIYLAFTEVIDWRVPLTYLSIIFVGSLILGLMNGLGILYPLTAISVGGVAFAAVFMLTDPVTNPHTRAGKIVFAAIAALVTLIIRFYTNYPEGAVISIIVANVLTLALDYLLQGKQIYTEKLGIGLVAASIIFGLFTMPVLNTALKAGSGSDGGGESASGAYKFTEDFTSTNNVVVEDLGNGKYHVTAHGYGMIVGGGGGEYAPNEFDIEIADGKVVSIVNTKFGDTPGIGDAALSEDYLGSFVDLSVDDGIDAFASATYTSESIIAAVASALQAAK